MIAATVTDTVTPTLRKMGERLSDCTPLFRHFGRYMMHSVRKNFDVGGRPVAWAALKTEWVVLYGKAKKWQRKQGRARMGGPLVLTGDLRGHIDFIPEPFDLVLTARPDPSVKGPVHQWGTTKAGRNRNITIPARPYLVFQPEDIDYFRKLADGWIRVGMNGLRGENP